MNPQQSSTCSHRNQCHDQDSSLSKTDTRGTKTHNAPGPVPDLPDFPDKTATLGNRDDDQHRGRRAKAWLSQPSDDVWCGSSWRDSDGICASATTPARVAGCEEAAR